MPLATCSGTGGVGSLDFGREATLPTRGTGEDKELGLGLGGAGCFSFALRGLGWCEGAVCADVVLGGCKGL
jgi:hypothetical protein